MSLTSQRSTPALALNTFSAHSRFLVLCSEGKVPAEAFPWRRGRNLKSDLAKSIGRWRPGMAELPVRVSHTSGTPLCYYVRGFPARSVPVACLPYVSPMTSGRCYWQLRRNDEAITEFQQTAKP